MRWWLALAFASIAIITAVTVTTVVGERSERSFRESAEELAVGQSVGAAEAIGGATRGTDLDAVVERTADYRGTAIFVFDDRARLISSPVSNGIALETLPGFRAAVDNVLDGGRVIRTTEDGTRTMVALPLFGERPGALVTYTHRPELRTQLGIVRKETGKAAFLAALLGIAAGFVVATMIAKRLARIAAAASTIAGGDFDSPLDVDFPDEVGHLAASVELMRLRLRESFATVANDRDRLDRLLARLHEGVVSVDRDLRVEFVNNCARRLLGADLAPGDPLPDPWPTVSLRRFAATLFGADARVEQLEIAPDDEHSYLLSGVPATERADSALLVVTDLSERVRSERAQRDFVTNAAHELRTPIAAILSSVEMLQSGAKDDPSARDEFLDHVEREAARLARLARALLVLQRAQAGQELPAAASVELGPLLEAVARDLRPQHGVTVDVSCPADLSVRGDPDLLEQAVMAVAGNAARYTDRGEIRLSAARANGRVAIEVSDTGNGIDAEDHDRVFERFYRGRARDATGFGLGLAIARESVKVLGGNVAVESESGVGTTVTVFVPAVREEAS